MFLQIYGPFQISSFNIAIAFGLITFIFFASRDARLKKIISTTDFINLTIESAIMAVIGGRILHILSDLSNYKNFYDIFSVWNGGLSVLGAVLAAAFYACYYLKKRNIDILSVLDVVAIYAPLIHAIVRIGCFFVGCCHGCPTESFLSIIYTNPNSAAPLNIPLHPTQLYSSFIYLAIFGFLLFISKKYNFNKGTILISYLILSSIERILIDFIRGDRIFTNFNLLNFTINGNPIFSFYQLIALSLVFGAITLFFCFNNFNRKKGARPEA